MKKFFRGFTLAELLLCVGIIGIVSAMGMTVAKKSTEKAYNLYFYTGYVNLYNAIADAVESGEDDYPDGRCTGMSSTGMPDNQPTNATPFVQHIANVLGVDEGELEPNGGSGSFTTKNGIEYRFVNQASCPGANAARIHMYVPAAKTRNNNGRIGTELFYMSDIQQLVPTYSTLQNGNNIIISLQERRDLLPAYIDDGRVGRNNTLNRANWVYERPIYGSYKDVFCSIYGTSKKIPNAIDCADVTPIAAGRTGVLKVVDPRKAK